MARGIDDEADFKRLSLLVHHLAGLKGARVRTGLGPAGLFEGGATGGLEKGRELGLLILVKALKGLF